MKNLITMVNESFKKDSSNTRKKFGSYDDRDVKNKRAKSESDDKKDSRQKDAEKRRKQSEKEREAELEAKREKRKERREKMKASVEKGIEKTKDAIVTTTKKVGELHDFITQDI